jgi:hypothetical protein
MITVFKGHIRFDLVKSEKVVLVRAGDIGEFQANAEELISKYMLQDVKRILYVYSKNQISGFKYVVFDQVGNYWDSQLSDYDWLEIKSRYLAAK